MPALYVWADEKDYWKEHVPHRRSSGLVHYIRTLAVASAVTKLADAELLQGFRAKRDEDAFQALVQRHGAMVLSVCRRVLHDAHEAEDAFQATFLVLSRTAGRVRSPGSVASWLYGVAYRVATRMKASASRRHFHEMRAGAKEPQDPWANLSLREVQTILDEELFRLPDKYRAPLVLCCLQDKTRDEAAQQLGWPLARVKSCLEQGRALLRRRLSRRGVDLSLTLAVTFCAGGAAQAGIPASLMRSTVEAALAFAAGHDPVTTAVSAEVAALTEGVLKSMLGTKLKTAAAILLATGVIAAGAGGWSYHSMTVAAAPADNGPSKITTNDPDAERIAKLIDQLGSDRFAEREAASRELDRLGAAALGALRKAIQSSDPETRRRAEALVKKIESRQFVCLDFQTQGNELTEWAFPGDENGEGKLPLGEQTLEGVKFNIGKKHLQLEGTNLPNRPTSFPGIKVDQKLVRLHFLHGTGYSTDDGTIIGQYVVTWDDGTTATIPIRFGKDLHEYSFDGGTPEASEAKTAWKGEHKLHRVRGKHIRLFLLTWVNPKPDKKLKAIDFSSTNSPCQPFCVAITAETKP
jgi:RNA polymerase sigma factor (sigma-70 family)